MTKDGLQRLLDILDLLDEKSIEYRIERQQPDGLMVTFARRNTLVEVEFFIDHLEFSYFKGDDANETDETALHKFITDRWNK